MKTFTIDTKTWKKITKWQRNQKEKDNSNYVSGERWSYCFSPGGLGTILIVKDHILNEEKDFTDFNNFAT